MRQSCLFKNIPGSIMRFHITVGDWSMLQPDAQAVRYDVFVIEQNIPVELEWDTVDADCIHAVAYLDEGPDAGRAVGTGRLLPDGHIGRMAVIRQSRGSGIGGAILEALMHEAGKRGDTAVMLNAQKQAEAFYGRYGFVRDGDEFEEAGIAHIAMRRTLA
jgi:predicted GNAT family N-acyltransferase